MSYRKISIYFKVTRNVDTSVQGLPIFPDKRSNRVVVKWDYSSYTHIPEITVNNRLFLQDVVTP